MSSIVLCSEVLTMTSREIAELCEKRHNNVMADCRKLADFYAQTYSPEKSGEFVKSATYTDSTGRGIDLKLKPAHVFFFEQKEVEQ